MDDQTVAVKRRSFEGKQLRFRQLAEARVGKTVRHIQRIGNLSDRTNYEYSSIEAEMLLAALSGALEEVRTRFNVGLRTKKPHQFKLFG